jgi:spermidine/putrescine transport system substrate-binding protein
MKRILSILLIATLVFTVFTGCSDDNKKQEAIKKYGSDTLKIFNAGEYVGENVIKNFEKQFGVKVIYDTFESNEMMYTKVQTGEVYDILIPSDYMIERLILEDRLAKLDKSLIPNISNLYDGVKGFPYDPNNDYSIPYLWGSVGIVYNQTKVSKEDLEKEGYSILKDTKYKDRIYMYDSERDSFMLAFKALGYSANTDNNDEINKAYAWLKELNDTMNPIYVTDEVKDNMVNGLKDMAVVYSGDAAYILNENKDMNFFMPNEGTNLWIDSMVIPKNAQNPKLAHEFINYILTYEASKDTSSTVGYASSNKQVLEEMTSEGGEYYGNVAYLPRSGYKKDEVFKHNNILKQKLTDLWIKVKASK